MTTFLRFAAFAAALALQPVCAETFAGIVVGVSDGDTVTVLDEAKASRKVRLMGIDAPESRQAFGAASKKSLSDLAYRQAVQVDWSKTDRYGRIVGKLTDDGGKDINLEQVRRGLAWHYAKYEREQTPEDRRLYSEAEAEARIAGVGLWKDPSPVPPWEFRREAKGNR